LAKLHELHQLIDQGKTTVLFFKDDDDKNVKAYISKDVQGHYTHRLSYPDGPSPFPQPQTEHYAYWENLLKDIEGVQTTSDQWSILADNPR